MSAPLFYPTGAQLVSPPAGVIPIAAGPQSQQLFVASGTFVANGATPVTVAALNVIATTHIIVSLNTVGGTVGAIPAVKTITPGTGFTVAATAGDTSTYNWLTLG